MTFKKFKATKHNVEKLYEALTSLYPETDHEELMLRRNYRDWKYFYWHNMFQVNIIKKAKMLQGKWGNSCWTFPSENEKAVRDLCLDIFGDDGLEQAKTVTFDVYLDDYDRPEEPYIKIGNVTIAERMERDRDVVLADNVMLVAGDFPARGGSVKHPSPKGVAGTVLRVKNFPADNYEKVKDSKGIILVSENVNKDALIAEKEAILKRLSEIEKILGEHNEKGCNI